jgi:hypothetical protein
LPETAQQETGTVEQVEFGAVTIEMVGLRRVTILVICARRVPEFGMLALVPAGHECPRN